MKRFLAYGLGVMTAVTGGLYAAKNSDNLFKLGDGSGSVLWIFDVGDGSNNPEVEGDSGQLKIKNVPLKDSQIQSSDIDLGAASNTSRLTLPAGDDSALGSLTRKEGNLFYSTDQKNVVFDDGTDLRPVGTGAGGGSGINLVANKDAEVNLDGWTALGTFERTQVEAEVGFGDASFKWTPGNVADRTVTSAALVMPNGLKNKSCLVRLNYNGDFAVGDYEIYLKNASDELTDRLALNPGSGWRVADLAFICPDHNVELVLTNKTTNPSALFFDDVHVGTDFRVGQTHGISRWPSYDETEVTLTKTPTTTVNKFWIIPFQDAQGNWYIDFSFSGTISPNQANQSFDIEGITFDGRQAFTYASTTAGTSCEGLDGTSTVNVIVAGTFGRVICAGRAAITAKPTWANKIAPPSETVTLDTQGWYVEARMQGGIVDLGLVDVADQEMSNPDLTMSLGGGSAPAEIPCTSGNEPSGTTCSSGDEVVGVAFEAPYAGAFEVCFRVPIQIGGDAGEVVNQGFRMAETSLDGLTVLQNSINRTWFGENFTTSAKYMIHEIDLCSIFNFSSAGKKLVKVLNSINLGGSPLTNRLLSDGAGGINNGRNIYMTVQPITSAMPQAVALVGPETETFTATSTGHNPACTVNFKIQKQDNKVDMCASTCSVGGTASHGYFQFNNVIPEKYWPNEGTYFTIQTIEGGVGKIGGAFVGDTGTIRYGAAQLSDTFNGATENGTRRYCTSWFIE